MELCVCLGRYLWHQEKHINKVKFMAIHYKNTIQETCTTTPQQWNSSPSDTQPSLGRRGTWLTLSNHSKMYQVCICGGVQDIFWHYSCRNQNWRNYEYFLRSCWKIPCHSQVKAETHLTYTYISLHRTLMSIPQGIESWGESSLSTFFLHRVPLNH